jgi:hypothetical protein
MGGKPFGDAAKTGAERQRRHRARLRASLLGAISLPWPAG